MGWLTGRSNRAMKYENDGSISPAAVGTSHRQALISPRSDQYHMLDVDGLGVTRHVGS